MKFTILLSLVFLLNAKSSMRVSGSGPPTMSLVDGPQSGSPKPTVGTRTDPNEQEAVYDIMKATGNDWATEIPDVCCGRWHGIECIPDKHNIFHVVSLSFGSLSEDTAFPTCDPTRSTISPSITKLPHLRTLFFYRCLTGNPQPIPSFLGRLGSSLQTLVLRENGLIGPIPHELSNLAHLTILDLHGNDLNGSIPVSLSKMTGLRSLDLSSNRLSGSIPNISLPKLSILDLNQNHLTGHLPLPLLSTNSLIKVDVSRNRISGAVPNLSLEDLVLLDLSYNALTSPLPGSFEGLKSLQALVLDGNPFGSKLISENLFGGLDDLMILGLSNTNLEGPIPESIGRLTRLRVLHLDGNRLNGTIPSSLGRLSWLSDVRLDNNNLTGVVPFPRERVWKMGRKLRLGNNLGLCYDQRSGLGDDLDSLSSAGIGLCDGPKSGPGLSVQHILKSSTKSGGEGVSVSRRMIGLGVVFVSVFSLF